MAEIYRRKILYKFQDELWTIMSYVPKLVKEDGVGCNYVESNLVDKHEILWQVLWRRWMRHVVHVKCVFEGNTCLHILSVLRQAHIKFLSQLTFWRETRQALQRRVIDTSGVEIRSICDNSLVARHSYHMPPQGSLKMPAHIENVSNIWLVYLLKRIRKCEIKSNKGSSASEHKEKEMIACDVVNYQDPSHVLQMRRRKRLKSSKEKARTKAQLCHGYNHTASKIGLCHLRVTYSTQFIIDI